ncbi:MAG: N-6 DNA methylase, partial [Opitutaceae bacterium]
MDKTASQSLIHETFKAPFDKRRYRDFIDAVCNGFDESTAQSLSVPGAFAAHVKSCRRLGTFESPEGELADVLIVYLADVCKLDGARTALRDFAAHKLKRKDGYKEAGLVVFVAPDSQSWRFSFVRMEYETKRDAKTGKIRPEGRLTPARRCSYLAGTDEECHTAQGRFLSLLQNATPKPTLSQIEEAFSVESVTKEFFAQYAALLISTQEALDSILRQDTGLCAKFRAQAVSSADFARKLLGQIVFLYFIQKKGWLGVPKGGDWGTGPRNFMRRLVDQARLEGKCFFNDVLEPLFYDTLATDRGHDAWCKGLQCRIPFLNGGLFEPLANYDWGKTSIRLPNSLFSNRERTSSGDIGSGIIDVFDRYNFTVNEAEPWEHDVAIDPEMLGKVFENLIEENRRKGLGAFYTPREIVHSMCQESLINYLDAALNRRACVIKRTDVEALICEGAQAAHYEAARKDGGTSRLRRLPVAVEKNACALDDALKAITVCDPAIGSGAFPVGMMTEIVRARVALTPYFNDVAERTPYNFKRHAIWHSLHGVDIDGGAVEIAKLRLWLSLVVDEEGARRIRPLPNLDHGIVTGSSLTFDYEIHFPEVFRAKGGFDVVIGNPPYISYGFRGGQKMTGADKKYLKREFANSAEYKISMYAIFMELGIRLSSPANGASCFIVPDSFLLGMYFSKIRALILRECDIRQIALLPFKVFKADVGFSVVYLFERNGRNHAANALRSITASSCEDLGRRRLAEFNC